MPDFWESKFIEEQTLWGFEPSDSAIIIKDFFLKNGIKDILIPGIGYGRNARIFYQNNFTVTGIEISKTAINLAKSANKLDIKIHHGSVTEMPFDTKIYDGIFCYALIHLLNKFERIRFIRNCYNQLKSDGYMAFTAISKRASSYRNGKQLSKDRFRLMKDLNVFYYDSESIQKEYGKYGLIEFTNIDEPIRHMDNEPPLECILIKCKKH